MTAPVRNVAIGVVGSKLPSAVLPFAIRSEFIVSLPPYMPPSDVPTSVQPAQLNVPNELLR